MNPFLSRLWFQTMGSGFKALVSSSSSSVEFSTTITWTNHKFTDFVAKKVQISSKFYFSQKCAYLKHVFFFSVKMCIYISSIQHAEKPMCLLKGRKKWNKTVPLSKCPYNFVVWQSLKISFSFGIFLTLSVLTYNHLISDSKSNLLKNQNPTNS